MGRATVEREIARLDALSRTRALDRGESIQLAKLIRTEKVYDRMRTARSKPVQPATPSTITAGSGSRPDATPLPDPSAPAAGTAGAENRKPETRNV